MGAGVSDERAAPYDAEAWDGAVAAWRGIVSAAETRAANAEARCAQAEKEAEEVTARTLHLAHGFRKSGAPVYVKAADCSKALCLSRRG